MELKENINHLKDLQQLSVLKINDNPFLKIVPEGTNMIKRSLKKLKNLNDMPVAHIDDAEDQDKLDENELFEQKQTKIMQLSEEQKKKEAKGDVEEFVGDKQDRENEIKKDYKQYRGIAQMANKIQNIYSEATVAIQIYECLEMASSVAKHDITRTYDADCFKNVFIEDNFKKHHSGKLEINKSINNAKNGLFIVVEKIFINPYINVKEPENIQILMKEIESSKDEIPDHNYK